MVWYCCDSPRFWTFLGDVAAVCRLGTILLELVLVVLVVLLLSWLSFCRRRRLVADSDVVAFL